MTDISASVLMALFLGSTGVIVAMQCLGKVACCEVQPSP